MPSFPSRNLVSRRLSPVRRPCPSDKEALAPSSWWVSFSFPFSMPSLLHLLCYPSATPSQPKPNHHRTSILAPLSIHGGSATQCPFPLRVPTSIETHPHQTLKSLSPLFPLHPSPTLRIHLPTCCPLPPPLPFSPSSSLNPSVIHPYLTTKTPPPIRAPLLSMTIASNHHHNPDWCRIGEPSRGLLLGSWRSVTTTTLVFTMVHSPVS